MVALAFSGKTVITLVWSLCAPSASPYEFTEVALDWQTSKLACVWHCSVGTLCADPGTLLSLASEERKQKALVPSLLALSAHVVASSVFQKLFQPQDQTIGTIWQIPLHLPATDSWLPWSWRVMLPCCMSLEKQLNIHKPQIIVFVHLLAQLKQSFCAKLVLPGPLSVGSLIFQLREDAMDTTFFEKTSTSGKKCIPNMFYFKAFDTKILNFPCPVLVFFFQKKTKVIMSVLNMTETPVFSLALWRISHSVMVKIVVIRFLRLLWGMNYSGIAE